METTTVWALASLGLMTIITMVYFCIFFGIFFVVGWAVSVFIRSVNRLLEV